MFIKRLKKIVFWFFTSLVSLLLLVYILLWLPPVQRLAVDIALREVMKITGNEITVGKIKFRPFNRLTLSDVYVGDLKKDTLLYVKDLSAKFSLLPLLSGKLQVKAVDINDFTAHINADSIGSEFNFQFLINAFASDTVTTTPTSPFTIDLSNISLANGRVFYDVLSELAVGEGFDYNHIHLQDFRLETDFSFTSVEDFMVQLKQLSLYERSGFNLQELTADITSENKRIRLSDFVLRLTKSELRVDEAYIDYSGTTLDSLTSGATYSLPVSRFVLYPSDLSMFYRPLKNIADSLLLELEVEGTLPAVNLDSFHFFYGSTLTLDGNAFIASYTDWQNSPLEVNIAQPFFMPQKLNRIIGQLSGTTSGRAVEIPINTNYVSLKAFLKGVLPNMQLNLNAGTSSGDLALKGTGGYVYSTGDAHVEATLTAQDFNLQQLLSNPMLGIASLRASVKGTMSGSGDIAAAVTADINRFDFNGYSYNHIFADALYAGDSVSLLAEVKDENVPLCLEASGKGISGSNPYLYLRAEAKHIMFDSLNLIPQYKGAELYANIRAEVQNFEPEKMKADISIDSLLLKTDRGAFYQDAVKLKMQNEENRYKSISINAPLIEAAVDGTFSFATLPVALSNSLSQYLNTFIPYQAVDSTSNDDFNLRLLLRNTDDLSNVLELPFAVSDSAMVSGYYNNRYNNVLLSAAIPTLRMGEIELLRTTVSIDNDTLAPKLAIFGRTGMTKSDGDTIKLAFMAKAIGDSVNVRAFANDPSDELELYGLLNADAHFTAREESPMPLVDIILNRGAIFVNKQRFNIKPSTIHIADDRYTINGFELADTLGGNIKVNGTISASDQDTVRVTIEQFYLSSIMAALRMDLDLKGEINGDIGAIEVLSNPIIAARYFNVDSISLNSKPIGNLELGSAWNNREEAVMIDAELWQVNGRSSRINGYVYPTKNKLSLNANMQALELDWLQPMTSDFLFGLSGALGMQLSAEGALTSPDLNGKIFFDDANIGVKTTNVQYKISDTLHVTPDKIAFNEFDIVDNAGNAATVTGGIGHKSFGNLAFDLNMRLQNFLLLNNPNQTDSMVYGKLNVDGTVNISGSDKNILAKASISNNGSGKVFLQMPESVRTAQQYTGITYTNTCQDTTHHHADSANHALETAKVLPFTLPLRVELGLSLTPQLTAGMVLNAASGDIASVSGNGNIQLTYDMRKDEVLLHGDYTVEKGSAAFSFQNVLKKQFQLAQGGKVTFRGDPMTTKFTVTAIYNIRADLATLDEGFSSDPYLSSSRVPVSCLINITGDINKMDISYDIKVLNVDESVQRKIEGLLYNDDLKIKQIAYLLALGKFYPPEGVVGASPAPATWTSLLSSTLSSQLNNLLANVLNENWTVGTELRAGDNGTDNLEANVIVSANLFNDRVTVTTNLGYKNSSTATDDFTGDFSVEYKLTKSGEWVIKAYNVTNDQFYEQAPTTQGVGVVYKKEAKRFKNLFKKRRNRGNNRNSSDSRENSVEQKEGVEQKTGGNE